MANRVLRPFGAALGLLVGLAAVAGACADDRAGSASATEVTSVTSDATATTPTTGAPSVAEAAPPTGTSPTTAPPDEVADLPLAGRIVVVDPGHNGRNALHTSEIAQPVDAGGFTKACNTTGTAEGSFAEAQLNWELASALRAELVALGAEVLLTRLDNEGWGPCIDERGLTAARAGADLLVSLHADGAAPGARGFHVIHPAALPGYTADTSERSRQAAVAVRDALVGAGFTTSTYAGTEGLVERGDLGTLNRAGTTAVMIEAGNLHDPGDLAVLRSPDGQTRFATALAAAVTALLGP